MADNVTLNAPVQAGGKVIRTDDDGSAQWQYVKLAFGADGTQTIASATNPLPTTPAVVSTSSSGSTSALDAAATTIVAANATRKSCLIYNNGSGVVYIGVGETATASMFPLAAGASLKVEATGLVSARNDTGGAIDIRFMDESY